MPLAQRRKELVMTSTTTPPVDKRAAQAAILAAPPGNNSKVKCERIRATLSCFHESTFGPNFGFGRDGFVSKTSRTAAWSVGSEAGFNTTDESKRFATVRAQFALHNHRLYQSGPNDGPGPVSYVAERWGMVRFLPKLDDVKQSLIQIGGRHE